MSMSWKSRCRLLVILFFGSLAAIPVFAPPRLASIDLQIGGTGYSFQKFSDLSAEEINRRTLQAAASIKATHR